MVYMLIPILWNDFKDLSYVVGYWRSTGYWYDLCYEIILLLHAIQ